jgi:uncharacterized protein
MIRKKCACMKIKHLLFILCFTCTATSCFAKDPFITKLVVQKTATLQKPADEVSMSISVLTQADTAEKALSDNNEKIHALINALKEVGIEKGEYFTGQFSIQPIYAPYPKNPPPDFKPGIISYEVTNSLNVKTVKLNLTPLIIDAAAKVKADRVSKITFGLQDPQMYRSEAIALATSNAMQDAYTLSDVANLNLVRIIDIRLDEPQIMPRQSHEMMYLAKADNVPFIEPSDVQLKASVTITFEIGSKTMSRKEKG